MKYPDIVKKLSEELDIPEDVIDTAYKSFYLFIRESIVKLPLKDDLSKEEFSKLRTNFNIPSIGKLHCTYERYLGMKEQDKFIKELKRRHEHKKD